jgi:hypothetical protein
MDPLLFVLQVDEMGPLMDLFNLFNLLITLLPTIVTVVVFLIWWFVVVPKVARTLTWARFGNKTISILGDDEGYIEIVPSKQHLPEGVINTKRGYRFLPRPLGNPGPDATPTGVLPWMYKKYTLKGLGKPAWFGYAGKVPNFNPPVGAVFCGTPVNPEFEPVQLDLTEITTLMDTIPKNAIPKEIQEEINYHIHPEDPNQPFNIAEFSEVIELLPKKKVPKELLSRIKDALETIKKSYDTRIKQIHVLDVVKMKGAVPKIWTPSQVEAVGMKRELIGMKKVGKQIGKYVFGIGVLIIIVVFAIVVLAFVFGGGMPGSGAGLIHGSEPILSLSPFLGLCLPGKDTTYSTGVDPYQKSDTSP